MADRNVVRIVAASLVLPTGGFAYLMLSGGDRRPLDVAVMVWCVLIGVAVEYRSRFGGLSLPRTARSVQVLLLFTALVVAWGAVGTWGYHRALAASRDGDSKAALSELLEIDAARAAPGVPIAVPGLVDAWLGTSGLVWVGESNVAFGVARNLEYLGQRNEALDWYERSLHVQEETGVGVRPTDIEAAIARIESTR